MDDQPIRSDGDGLGLPKNAERALRKFVHSLIDEYFDLDASARRGEIIPGKTAKSKCCGRVMVIGRRFDGEYCKTCLRSMRGVR